MADARAASAEFLALIEHDPLKPAEIAAFLDGLGHEERVAAIRATGRRHQRRLYACAAGQGGLALTDFVPAGARPFETVRHFGKNTLPAFTLFEKRFCRPPDEDAAAPRALWGFNFQSLTPLTGPGYYIAYTDPAAGEALVDYNRVPPSAPPGWPAVRPNERGFSRFVYGYMIDRLRRLSRHVTIGSAARRGKEIGSWFLLCREP